MHLLLTLPEHIQLHIFGYLEPEDVCRLQGVCRLLTTFVDEHRHRLQRYAINTLGINVHRIDDSYWNFAFEIKHSQAKMTK
jgi:hypothetical protein